VRWQDQESAGFDAERRCCHRVAWSRVGLGGLVMIVVASSDVQNGQMASDEVQHGSVQLDSV
jgi:hypothetical protein